MPMTYDRESKKIDTGSVPNIDHMLGTDPVSEDASCHLHFRTYCTKLVRA